MCVCLLPHSSNRGDMCPGSDLLHCGGRRCHIATLRIPKFQAPIPTLSYFGICQQSLPSPMSLPILFLSALPWLHNIIRLPLSLSPIHTHTCRAHTQVAPPDQTTSVPVCDIHRLLPDRQRDSEPPHAALFCPAAVATSAGTRSRRHLPAPAMRSDGCLGRRRDSRYLLHAAVSVRLPPSCCWFFGLRVSVLFV
jgi:hypothetical protein